MLKTADMGREGSKNRKKLPMSQMDPSFDRIPNENEQKIFAIVQSPLVIVDSSVSGKLSTIKRESTITREIHAKIDIWSAHSIHYNERIH